VIDKILNKLASIHPRGIDCEEGEFFSQEMTPIVKECFILREIVCCWSGIEIEEHTSDSQVSLPNSNCKSLLNIDLKIP